MLYLLFSNHMKQFDGYKHWHEIQSHREWERNKCGKGHTQGKKVNVAIDLEFKDFRPSFVGNFMLE